MALRCRQRELDRAEHLERRGVVGLSVEGFACGGQRLVAVAFVEEVARHREARLQGLRVGLRGFF